MGLRENWPDGREAVFNFNLRTIKKGRFDYFGRICRTDSLNSRPSCHTLSKVFFTPHNTETLCMSWLKFSLSRWVSPVSCKFVKCSGRKANCSCPIFMSKFFCKYNKMTHS